MYQPGLAPYWWGEPWPSFVCYGDDDRLREDARVPFPEPGRKCPFCDEAIRPGDSGEVMPFVRASGNTTEYVHKECQLRQVVGCLAHLEGRCRCGGGHDHDDPCMSAREEALAVWEWVRRNRTGPGATQ